jgi:hypothetical protein
MNPVWFMRADWPLDHELARRTALIDAVRGLPDGDALDDNKAEGLAILIWSAHNRAQDDELPRNRPASTTTTEAELRKLHDLCVKLADHIEGMHSPAVGGIYIEGAVLFDLASAARQMAETATHVEFEGENARGAGEKIVARQTTEMASHVYEHVTERRPTFTSGTETGAVSGAWPDFLTQVFEALWIKASVAAQVRAISEKKPLKQAI